MDSLCEYTDYLPFYIEHTVDSGNSSHIYFGHLKRDNKPCAIKTCSINDTIGHNIILEAKILENCQHRNMPKFYGFYRDDEDYYLVMEYIDGPNLLTYMQERMVTSRFFNTVSKQLVDVVLYLHKSGIVHRDIKLENMVWDWENQRVVLVDYGLSAYIKYSGSGDELMLGKSCGSPMYMAPELWETQPYYGRPVDMYSLGICFYTLLHGQFPYPCYDDKVYEYLHSYKVHYEDVGDDWVDLIKRMINHNPNQRINAENLQFYLPL